MTTPRINVAAANTGREQVVKIDMDSPLGLRDLLKGIVAVLEGYDFGYAFQEPVVGEAYERVIERPMCYDWVLAKLNAGTYEDMMPEYLMDMLMVYENCYR